LFPILKAAALYLSSGKFARLVQEPCAELLFAVKDHHNSPA
jgi:hypothetical protein